MSRCFPFPPPGYEKKVRIDDIDLLAQKKKHKEKELKKDKKDKEKRERKEKRDKDRSKEKHGERKDRKEKHKDKKERDEDNGNTRTSEEKIIEGQPESSNGQKHSNGFHNVDIKDNKLERRYQNDDRATGSEVVKKIAVTNQRPLLSNQSREKERIKDKNEDRTINGQRATGSQVVQKIMVTGKRPLLSNQSRGKERIRDKKEDDRTVNAQRNHVEGKCAAEASVQNFPRIDQRKLEGIVKTIEKDVEKQIEGRDRKKNTDDDSKSHKPMGRDKKKKVKSKDKVRDSKKEKKEKVKEISKPSNGQPELEGSGKDSLDVFITKASILLQVNGKKSAGGGNLGKRKEPEMNEYLHENGFLPHKLQRSVSSHPVVENGKKSEPSQTVLQFLSEWQGAPSNCKVGTEEHKIFGFRGSEQPNACSKRPSSSKVTVNENGGASAKPPHPDFKYPSEVLSIPNACSTRPSSSDVEVNENGGASAKPPHSDPKYRSEMLSIPNACSTRPSSSDVKVNDNGGAFVKPPHPDSKYTSEILSIPNTSATRPSSSNVKDENGGASAKRPHPDSKHLSEILSIPKMVDESDIDENEWLFSGNSSASKKPKLSSPEVEMTPQVWAEAMKIESLDVYALPYVIPY